MNYFIFGRPRSRTAWTANFLTQHQSFCFHEGLSFYNGSVQSLKRAMPAIPKKYVGNADTGMIHYTQEIIDTFPDARFVVMTGASLSWNIFAQKHVGSEVYKAVEEAYADTKERLRHKALFVDVGDLTSDMETAQRLHDYCNPNSVDPWDLMRYNMLKDLNIQVRPDRLKERLGL